MRTGNGWAVLRPLSWQVDKGVGVDVLALVQDTVDGERFFVEAVVHGVGACEDGAVFGAAHAQAM